MNAFISLFVLKHLLAIYCNLYKRSLMTIIMGDDCCGGSCSSEETNKEFALQPDGSYRVIGSMVIADVVAAFPKAATVMLGYGLHCVGCHANAFDTIDDGARGHGMQEDEILRMITEINTVINHRIATVEFTPKAIEKALELRSIEKGKETFPLRITVMGGGCSGPSYEMDFDEKKENDMVLQFGALAVIIDPDSFPGIKGSSIDYVDSPSGSGFKIENPNKGSCECGKGGCD